MLLKNVKVLELSNFIPGPMCSLFLADLGAHVVKIEGLNGDPMRNFEASKNISPYFSALNRNKKSIALNLKTEEGKKIFMALAKNADVIIEGFRPGKMDALGIGYSNVKKINPKIVYCSITGYGQKGIYKDKAGHDLNYSALSGLLDLMSEKPVVPRLQIADTSSAIIAAFSIMAALFSRERNGSGYHIDVPMLNSTLSFIGMHIAKSSLNKNSNNLLYGTTPCYNVYQTKDGRYISLGAIENKFWESFCKSISREDMVTKQFDGSMMKEMGIIFESRTLKQWIKLNEKYDFCCEPIKNIKEVLIDKRLSNVLIKLGGLMHVAMPVNFSQIGRIKYSKSPELGEHTIKLLSSLGYNEKSVVKLKKMNVVI